MKIHPLIAASAISVILTLQAWMLSEIFNLNKNVAVLNARIEMHLSNKIASAQ